MVRLRNHALNDMGVVQESYAVRFAAHGARDPAAQQAWCDAALASNSAFGESSAGQHQADGTREGQISPPTSSAAACAGVAFARAQLLSEATGAITLLCALAMLVVVVAVRRLLTGGTKVRCDVNGLNRTMP